MKKSHSLLFFLLVFFLITSKSIRGEAVGINSCGNITTDVILTSDIDARNQMLSFYVTDPITGQSHLSWQACLIIKADNIVIDGNGHRLIGDNGLSIGIINNGRKLDGYDGVTIKNFAGIEGFSIGILGRKMDDSTIINNKIKTSTSIPDGSGAGISVGTSDNVIIKDNSLVSEKGKGIELVGSVYRTNGIIIVNNKNIIDSNYVETHGRFGIGIWVQIGANNTINNNEVVNSGPISTGIESSQAYGNIITNNKITSVYTKPFSDSRLDIDDSSVYGINVVESSFNVIDNNKIKAIDGANTNWEFAATSNVRNSGWEYRESKYNSITNLDLLEGPKISIISLEDVKLNTEVNPNIETYGVEPVGGYLRIVPTYSTAYIDYITHYDNSDLNNVAEQNLSLYRHNGTNWYLVETSSVDVSKNEIRSGLLKTFGIFAVFDYLPVYAKENLCGNNICDAGENNITCPNDCFSQKPINVSLCGNSICDAGEDNVNCPNDCPIQEPINVLLCSNGICDAGEDNVNCPSDCPIQEQAECYTDADCSQNKVCVQGECYKKEELFNESQYEKPLNGACPSDKVLVCHIEAGEHNICVPTKSVDSHLRHDDYLGECVGEKRYIETVEEITKDQNVVLEVRGQIVKEVKFNVKEKKEDAKIRVRTRSTSPNDVRVMPRKVYNYVIIEHPEIENEDIGESKIKFAVEDSWLISQGSVKEDIVLSKYNGNWVDLKTTYLETIGNKHYYEAVSNGLSTFAININPNKLLETTSAENTLAQNEESEIDKTLGSEQEILKEETGWNKIIKLATQKENLPTWIVLISLVTLVLVLILPRTMVKKEKKPVVEKEDPFLTQHKTLIDYTKTLRKKGLKEDEIKKDLIDAGWDNKVVEGVMKYK